MRRSVLIVLATTLLVVACTSPGLAPTSAGPVRLTVGLGYIPSVQFAQFYFADQAGYYRDAGLDVTFHNRIDPELITLIGRGAVDIGMGDATSVIPAVSQGIPVRYAVTVYGRFPNVVFTKRSTGITAAADLADRRIGTPGRFGSSWIGLQALLASADLTLDDVEVQLFPDFGQGVAVREGVVDAATGFANNEPVQLERAGESVVVLRVDEAVPLPGPGLVVGEGALTEKREALRAFTSATLRAMEEITSEPERGLDAAIARVPELGDDRQTQAAILDATIEMWRSPRTAGMPLGTIDREGWAASIEFMRGLPDSQISDDLRADQLVTDVLLPDAASE